MSRSKENASLSARLRTTVGGLVTSDSDSLETLPIGTTGQVLTVDTALASKMKWATPAASGFTAGQITDLTDAGDSTLHYHATDRALSNATGTLAIANGGTGNTTAQAAINALTAVSGATAGDVLTKVGSDATWVAPAGAGIGDVSGPASAVADSIATYNGTSGKIIKDGGILSSAIVTKTGAETLTNKTISTGCNWQGNGIGTLYGGTGLTSYVKGDILYSSTANTLAKLPVGSLGYSLTVSSAGIPSWTDVGATIRASNNTWTGTNFFSSRSTFGDISWIDATNVWAGWTGVGTNQMLVSSGYPGGKNAGLFATRTSDVPAGSLYWTLGVISVNNNASATTGYGLYLETHRKATSHVNSITQGVEISVNNNYNGASVTDPYNTSSAGLVEGMRIGTQVLNTPSYYSSTGLAILSETATTGFHNGIIIGNNAISPGGNAISLASGHRITWYSSAGVPSGFIKSDATSSAAAMRLIFGNNITVFQNNSGVNSFGVTNTGVIQINTTTAGTAGAVAAYLPVTVNGISYKLALLAA